jgi:DNA-binding beta-propeller fold protein YncE
MLRSRPDSVAVMRRGRERAALRRALIVALVIALAGALGAAPAVAQPTLIRAFGKLGTGAGRFHDPIGVAIGKGGQIYVADAMNDRVDEFTSGGRFVRTWGFGVRDGSAAFEICTSSCQAGMIGSGDGEFDFPWGVAVNSAGHVFVTDSGNNRVEEFTAAGAFVEKFGTFGSGAGQLFNPLGITFSAGGDLYIVDNGNQRIDKFTPQRAFIRAWGWGVADGGHRLETCMATCRTGLTGKGNGEFHDPDSIITNAAGRVLVTDNGNDRVEKFGGEGAFVARWGSKLLSNPFGIVVDTAGRIEVADTDHDRIVQFDESGAFLSKWGAAALHSPSGLAALPQDRLLVTDTGHNRAVKYAQTG